MIRNIQDFVRINQKQECGDGKDFSTTNKQYTSNHNNIRSKHDFIPLNDSDRVINKYQTYRTDHNHNKLYGNMISCAQRIPHKGNDKNIVLSSYFGNGKRDNIKQRTSLKLNSDHTKSVESNTKNKNLPVYNEICCYFKDLLCSNKNNKYIGSAKNIYCTRKANNNLKEKKSSLEKICNNSINKSKRSNITNNATNDCKRKFNLDFKKVKSEHKVKRHLEKFESKINMVNDEHCKGPYINLDKYVKNVNYVQRSVSFISNKNSIVKVFPRSVKKKNPFQFKLNNDTVCFFVNLKCNKEGMCLEWAKKEGLPDKNQCKSKSKPKNKCVNYEKQLKVAISDDCVVNNTFYERSKQYFKDFGSKFNKCFIPQRSPAICNTLHDSRYRAACKSNNNIICECKIEKQKTPSKGSVELENKKSLLRQNRSCNTFQCCKPNFKTRLITAVKKMFNCNIGASEIGKKKLDGSLFKIKIDPVTMKVINKREVRKKIKLQNKKVSNNCSPKTPTNSVIKGKAYLKNDISPTASDCKGPLFEIKLDRNNMRILNLSEILHKIRRLDCSLPVNDAPKPRVQKKVVNKCDSKQLRDIKSKISCLWTQFSCKPQNTVPHHKYNYYNANHNIKNTSSKQSNHLKRRKKVYKSHSNKKSKVRKKKHKRKKRKPIHKKKIKKRSTKRAKQHKKKVKSKNKKLHREKIIQQRKRDKRRKAKMKKKKDKCRKIKKKQKQSKPKKKRVNTCCTELSKFLADYLFCYTKSSKPNKCKKPPRRKRKRCEHMKYHCRVGHLRKSEISWMWLYIVCPSLYPSYLFFRSTLRNLGRLLLSMLALILWCPFILIQELCRIFCCIF